MTERIEHDGVEGIRVGRFPSHINTTTIVYRFGTTVIDTGPPNQWRAVRRFLEERPVSRVLVTHHHEDHSGNLAAIRELLDPEIFAPPAAVALLAEGFPLRLYQHLFWGRPRRVRPEPVPDVLEIDQGRSLQALPTPGHSADMTCYLEPERGWLFTGDLFIARRSRYLREDEDLPALVASLRRVLDLDFATVFCGHRGVVPAGKEALRAKLVFLETFCERVQELRGEGRNVAEITRILLGGKNLPDRFTGSHFSKRNLIKACLTMERDQGSGENNVHG
ncbi:MAG: MBL fold metallo-hydrolase [bacterium]|nr:MBL fold metallo-hydrolase [bacterium]